MAEADARMSTLVSKPLDFERMHLRRSMTNCKVAPGMIVFTDDELHVFTAHAL
jgi:hypothetical protein